MLIFVGECRVKCPFMIKMMIQPGLGCAMSRSCGVWASKSKRDFPKDCLDQFFGSRSVPGSWMGFKPGTTSRARATMCGWQVKNST